jgi:CheY-like chemotaxis protein
MGKTILLADDSVTIRQVVDLTFADQDVTLVSVGNGRQAVEKARTVKPDLVICDVTLPDLDGYEVCRLVKNEPGLSGVPVLLLSGAFEPFDEERARASGYDDVMQKPFEPQTLVGKVKQLLKQG